MKILKQGKVFTRVYRGTCKICDCEIECNPCEIFYGYKTIGRGIMEHDVKVAMKPCPNVSCTALIELEEIKKVV